jgi:hypothetical protein
MVSFATPFAPSNARCSAAVFCWNATTAGDLGAVPESSGATVNDCGSPNDVTTPSTLLASVTV